MAVYDPTETYRKRSFRNILHQARLKRIEIILKGETKNRSIQSYMDFSCASGFITSRIKQSLHIPNVHGSYSLQDYINSAAGAYLDINFELINLNKQHIMPQQYDLVTCSEHLSM
jgi:2-polyprenyl-3-methyl-5-hydroxy-6-metoxy-1,4-benzoquinol methylase